MPPVSKAPTVVKTASGQRSIRISFWLGMVTAALSATIFIALGFIIDQVATHRATVMKNGLWQALADMGYRWVVAVVVIAVVGAGVSEWVRTYYSHTAAVREENLLRRLVMRRLFLLGPQVTDREEAGSLVSTCTDGVERIATYRQTYLGTLWAGFAVPGLSLVVMAIFVDWKTALILAAMFPLIPALLAVFKLVMTRFSGGQRHARNRLAAAYLEAIVGLETLTLLGAADRMGKRLRDVGEDNRQAIMTMLAGNQLILFVVDSGFNLCLITVATVSVAVQAGMGIMSVGQVVAVLALTVLLLEPMDQLAGFFYVGMGGMANERKVARIFGEPARMLRLFGKRRARRTGHAGAQREGHPGGGHPGGHRGAAGSKVIKETPRLSDRDMLPDNVVPVKVDRPLLSEPGAVSVRDMRFAYDGDRPVIDRCDLDVAPGEHIAIMGPSGEGKSTLVKLLNGTLTSTHGALSVNGQVVDRRGGDTPSVDDASSIPDRPTIALRTASAFVAQSTWLFNGSVAMNLQVANPNATTDMMWQALEQAYLADDIRSMPEGLDTWVGDRGFGLSGGQMQRLSLARALLSQRDIIICDEPTSQVDLLSEEQILQSIAHISADKTVIMVTHRRSSLAGIDTVYHMRNGRLYREVSHE